MLRILGGVPPIHDYFTHPEHDVRHVPHAILAARRMILSASSVYFGVLLHATNKCFLELHNVLVR